MPANNVRFKQHPEWRESVIFELAIQVSSVVSMNYELRITISLANYWIWRTTRFDIGIKGNADSRIYPDIRSMITTIYLMNEIYKKTKQEKQKKKR